MSESHPRQRAQRRRAQARGLLAMTSVGLFWTGCFYGVSGLAPATGGSSAAGSGGSIDGGDTGGNAGSVELGGSGGLAPCLPADIDCEYRQRCTDSALVPRVFVGGQTGPWAVVADKTYVFWSDRDSAMPSGGRVRRREVAGGATTDLVTGELDPGALALDANFVYWVSGSGNVSRTARDSTADDAGTVTVDVIATSQRAPTSLALDASYVYWLNRGSGQLLRSEKDAPRTPAKVLATGQPKPAFLAADASTLYWTTSAGFVESAPKAGGPTTDLVTASDLGALLGATGLASVEAAGIAVDTTWVYFRARGLRMPPLKDDTGKLLRVHKDGSELAVLIDNRAGAIGPLRIDGTKLYFTTGSSGGEVWRVETDGTGLVLLNCQAEAYPYGITTAANRAYWTNFTGATVVWAPK